VTVIHVLGGLVWAGRNEAGSRKGKGVWTDLRRLTGVDRGGWGGVGCGAVQSWQGIAEENRRGRWVWVLEILGRREQGRGGHHPYISVSAQVLMLGWPVCRVVWSCRRAVICARPCS
jgi:hypothetical protein